MAPPSSTPDGRGGPLLPIINSSMDREKQRIPPIPQSTITQRPLVNSFTHSLVLQRQIIKPEMGRVFLIVVTGLMLLKTKLYLTKT